MPDIFNWLGITKIDHFASMSDMKYNALVSHNIEIINRIPIPPELIPEDAAVEMEAKKAAGYFVPDPDQIADDDKLKNTKGRHLDE